MRFIHPFYFAGTGVGGEDGVRTEYECRFRFPNEVYIDRFLLVLAGAERVSGQVIIRDERSDRQLSETFIAEQGMNTIRFRERLRADSVKVIVLMGRDDGVLPRPQTATLDGKRSHR